MKTTKYSRQRLEPEMLALGSSEDTETITPDAHQLTLELRPPFPRRRKSPAWQNRTGRGRSGDDPPPCPARAALPARPIFVMAAATTGTAINRLAQC
jgi:hypothetical protein